jgi:hypothetical protein
VIVTGKPRKRAWQIRRGFYRVVDSASRLLLILACSARKRHDVGMLPALARYDGVNYRVLRKAQRETTVPDTLDVLILSAEYGILDAQDQIPDYDRLMTPTHARELQPQVAHSLATRLATRRYDEAFVLGGKTYRIALETATSLHNIPRVAYAQGGIGEQMAQLKHWLADHARE